jgi:hypothetical protein
VGPATGFAVGPVPLRSSYRHLLLVGCLDLAGAGCVRLLAEWEPSLCRGSGLLPVRQGAVVCTANRFSCWVSGSQAGSQRRPALAQTSNMGRRGRSDYRFLGAVPVRMSTA